MINHGKLKKKASLGSFKNISPYIDVNTFTNFIRLRNVNVDV